MAIAQDSSTEGTPRSTERTPLLRDVERGDESPVPSNVADGQAAQGDAGQPVVMKEYSTAEAVLIMSSVWVGVFLAALDMTIVSTLSVPISSYFNSLSLLSWVASSYLVSTSACQPLLGKLTDIFSRRTGLIYSNVLFGLGNLLSGIATQPWMIILGRVVAGMGGGGLNAISTFIMSDLVPLRRRGVWQGMGNICFGVGAAGGGLFGGWINDTWGWRWAFLVQVPFMVFSTILVLCKVNIPIKEHDQSRLKRIDFLGSFTLTISLVLLLIGLNTGGNQVPWTHPLIIAAFILAAIFLGLFVYVEECVALEPVIPVNLLLHRTVMSACLTNWFTTMVTMSIITYIPVYFQVSGNSATEAGARLAPYAIGTAMGSMGFGVLMNATGRYLFFGWLSLLLVVIANADIVTFNLHTSVWEPFAVMAALGVGYGGMLTITLVALVAAVDHRLQAIVTSASYAFRSTGSCIGITVASSIFQNLLKQELWTHLGSLPNADEVIGRLRDNIDELNHLPAHIHAAAVESYATALHGVFVTTLGIAVLAFLSVLMMREHKLHNNLSRRD